VVEEESDRVREENAARAARRIVATLQRGPYLQLGTPDSMVVRWRTDRLSPSVVRFGLSETNLKYSARTRGVHGDHAVVLTNLTPGTRYFYALGTNLLSGTHTIPSTNAPAPGSPHGSALPARRCRRADFWMRPPPIGIACWNFMKAPPMRC